MDSLPPPTTSPCVECPWRRTAARGWLGPYTADEWLKLVTSDAPIACHRTIKTDESWDGAKQCAGAAAFRSNICKMPRSPEVAVGPGREDVFATGAEFADHHNL